MDFELSPRTVELRENLLEFMDEQVYPAERTWHEQVVASGDPYFHPPVMEELKAEARRRGLWNLFLPDERYGAGLTNLEYAPLAEVMGRSHIAPEATNCAAPDTGNMEILAEFGTEQQRTDWLEPLLAGEIRSCFAMTEPDVASSDATNVSATITRAGDEYVLNGRKWWTSGAASERCKIAIFLGLSNPENDTYARHSMILVPLETPGVEIIRTLPVFGYEQGHGGHCEILFDDVRVPAENMLGAEGAGFLIAQSRLGPGRIHHCMRAIGMAERAFDLMCERAHQRVTFGKPLAAQGVIREWIAESRIDIEQARLLVLKTAWLMDHAGNKGARIEIAAIKVAAPAVAARVIDRAIQVHGGAGVSNDFPLASMYAAARTLRIADGPDEVHKLSIARRELRRYEPQLQPVG
jgi:acyl-CoA dehydrogenase